MFPRRTHLVLALVAALAAPVAASADTTFTFTGHGYGHGVGMGQYGAQGYAQHGWTHEQILAHYYQGTTLGASGVAQVRVLLQEKLTQAAASAPAGVTAADEGGSATLAVAGPARRDRAQGRRRASRCVDATGAVLASGWTGPVALTATGGGPVTLAGRRRSTACATGATAAAARARRGRRPRGRERRLARELPARRRRERDAVDLAARGAARRRRSPRAPTRWRRASPRRARSTSIPTSAARSTAASRRRASPPRPRSTRRPGRSSSTRASRS